MNATEQQYFDELQKIQERLSGFLKDPRISGVNEVISNLYRDDAHFLYELLQNADDQGATYVKFILDNDELLFIHNAPRHFSITNPHTHEDDKKNGCLGDVNSILSIASSSKSNRTDDIPIGKFGLGFKSVFIYTDCPQIFDENIRFEITDFIVPRLIECDHPRRGKGETLFRFKFKAEAKDKAEKEIGTKLKTLIYPLLFLNHLRLIDWEDADGFGSYRLDDVGRKGNARCLRYTISGDESRVEKELWKYSRPLSSNPGLEASAVFVLEDGKLSSAAQPLYCYLPTANNTGLPVILHAPFRLTGNRESITPTDAHNLNMIEELAGLLAESLADICKRGQACGTPWINDNIIAFLPESEDESTVSTTAAIDLSPIRSAVLSAIKTGRMLWCGHLGEYLSPTEAFIPDNNRIAEVYQSPQLQDIFGEKHGWVLHSLVPDLKKEKGDKIINELGVEHITPDKILRRITPAFLGRQSLEWLAQWYTYLPRVQNLWKTTNLWYQEIILTGNGDFKAAHTKENTKPNVFLLQPDVDPEQCSGVFFVHPELAANENLKDFFASFGIGDMDAFSKATSIYLPIITSESTPFEERLRRLLAYIDIAEHRVTTDQRYKLREQCMIPASSNRGLQFHRINDVKIHNADNDLFFKGNHDQPFFEPEKLIGLLSDSEVAILSDFVYSFTPASLPTVNILKLPIINSTLSRIPADARRPGYSNRMKLDYEYIEEPIIEGLDHFLSAIAPVHPREASAILETILKPQYHKAKYCVRYYGCLSEFEIWPEYRAKMIEAPWIEYASSNLRRILELPVKELQQTELDAISKILSESGIVSESDVDNFLSYIKERGILEDFELKQQIEQQKSLIQGIGKCSLAWLDEVLSLRLKYVESGQKSDIEFLIRALKQALSQIDVDTDADLRDILPDNINIIFGPPGTGKTTEITNIIAGILAEKPDSHIAVLTPTNKAADVVAKRLMQRGIPEIYRAINSENSQAANDAAGNGLPIYDAMIDGDVPQITVSTVHHFARPAHLCNGHTLHEEVWDAVFIDETSMVTLDYVLLALFKCSSLNRQCVFYIAGDPLQLPAITNLDPDILEQAQLDEFNFFAFIGLNEFSENPEGMPGNLKDRLNIKLLSTQYRSIRPLCELMSNFAYGGNINSDFQGRILTLPKDAPSIFRSPLSFVRFPVAKAVNPDIRSLGKLKGSNYNIYSALLVKESLQKLFDSLSENNYRDELSVGIITPYTAQKKLIEKLLNTNAISRDASVEVFVNTVHQFQGDEFDIVMLILNPPNMSMSPADKILINKQYLINVATSRAKNVLVILYPDGCTCNDENYLHINKNSHHTNLETIAEEVFGCPIGDLTISSVALEEELFGSADYLAGLCEIMQHEDVNLHIAESTGKYRFVTGGDTIDIIYT